MAATLEANGYRVSRATITLPRIGVWHADLDVEIDDASKVGDSIRLSLAEGALELRGTARRAGVYGSHTAVRMVGGAGGFLQSLDAKYYRSIPARIPVNEALAAGKEKLSESADAGKLGTQLAFWTRPEGTVGDAFQVLVNELNATWRVLADGTVWLGDEKWPDSKTKQVHILDEAPEAGRLTLSSEAPDLLPGTVLDGRKISRVEHSIAPSSIITTAWVEAKDTPNFGDVLRAAFERVVRRMMLRLDYQAFYPCKVVSQNGDGSLELKPELDRKLPGLSRVPIRYGIPGVKVKVSSGARVHLSYDNGDPAKPFAAIWDPDSLKEVEVTASVMATVKSPMIKLNSGARPIARQGDSVMVTSTPPGTPAVGVIISGSADTFN